MSWTRKETPSPFDDKPIEGLCFLDGDLLADNFGQNWTKGEKYPVVVFPSGQEFPIWPTLAGAVIHLFGEMDVLYFDTLDKAFKRAQNIAQAAGYTAEKADDHSLILRGHTPDEHLKVTYDPQAGRITDVVWIEPEEVIHPAHQLMTDEIKAQLPALYSNEHKGMDSIAPVKYFTPDSNWTWYPTEFDGEDLMFGLVVGYVIELGFFSLSELKEIGGPLVLPIERDLHYEPKTLRELIEHHKQMRGER